MKKLSKVEQLGCLHIYFLSSFESKVKDHFAPNAKWSFTISRP